MPNPRPRINPEDRLPIVERIFVHYVEGNTIESCCEKEGINPTTFYAWVETTPHFQELYKKAKNDFRLSENNKLVQRARNGLWIKTDFHQKVKEDERLNVESGQFVVVGRITETLPPDTTACLGALNNLDPDFAPKNPNNNQADQRDKALGEAVDESVLFKKTDGDQPV